MGIRGLPLQQCPNMWAGPMIYTCRHAPLQISGLFKPVLCTFLAQVTELRHGPVLAGGDKLNRNLKF